MSAGILGDGKTGRYNVIIVMSWVVQLYFYVITSKYKERGFKNEKHKTELLIVIG